jgi:ATP-dependent Clp protease adaptor protein ClpS
MKVGDAYPETQSDGVGTSTLDRLGRTLVGMATKTDTQQDQRTARQILPPWRVMLHNDDVNDMRHVVRAITRSVPSVSFQQAASIMLEAHQHGVAQVVICPKEHAEMYRERLEGYGLTSTIEPV